ncbi:hypothetical protein AXA84_0039 [Candidatus Phytoplasma oryzae]|uniref:Uncharacterized protein n=1 Tax=Candidatus Phytoplasma oryzae TaxID=203274 RepID=A0A139JRC8_9MOLU|nr:hypothetical protein [Candidatus Phytoplasma oryzae]KXT29394.1 hypothetical protein AXA84_0039 [Candidatus Phytoplasma oryzae]RAM57977.1 hypothetical protein DH96_00210 [Candidatus Phytoplasma oryzae]
MIKINYSKKEKFLFILLLFIFLFFIILQIFYDLNILNFKKKIQKIINKKKNFVHYEKKEEKKVVIKNKIPKPEIFPIDQTWIENNNNQNIIMIKKKWIFYGLNGINFYKEKIIKNKNKIDKLKKIIDIEEKNKNVEKIEKIKNQIEFIGLKTYGTSFYDYINKKYLPKKIINFYPFDNLIELEKIQQEPKKFNNCIYDTFDQWNNWDNKIIFEKSEESLLFNYLTIMQEKKDGKNILILEYTGPKEILEEELMDYYLGKIKLSIIQNESNKDLNIEYKCHFNPFFNTLSIYKEKFNYKNKIS